MEPLMINMEKKREKVRKREENEVDKTITICNKINQHSKTHSHIQPWNLGCVFGISQLGSVCPLLLLLHFLLLFLLLQPTCIGWGRPRGATPLATIAMEGELLLYEGSSLLFLNLLCLSYSVLTITVPIVIILFSAGDRFVEVLIKIWMLIIWCKV